MPSATIFTNAISSSSTHANFVSHMSESILFPATLDMWNVQCSFSAVGDIELKLNALCTRICTHTNPHETAIACLHHAVRTSTYKAVNAIFMEMKIKRETTSQKRHHYAIYTFLCSFSSSFCPSFATFHSSKFFLVVQTINLWKTRSCPTYARMYNCLFFWQTKPVNFLIAYSAESSVNWGIEKPRSCSKMLRIEKQ